MWGKAKEWGMKKKVFVVIVCGMIALALVGWLTGWWSSDLPPAS